MDNKALIKNIVVTLLVIFSMFALSTFFTENTSEGKLKILVSILPQKEFVSGVFGDNVEVQELIHAGESPATYTMTVSDITLVENADIYFMHGHLPFEEANLDKIKEINTDIIIVDLSEGVELRYFGSPEATREEHEEEIHDHKGVDPHYWLTPNNAIKNVESIRDFMIDYDSGNSTLYTDNTNKYISRLNELNVYMSDSLAPLTGETFLCYHPSWGYFTEEYGLIQHAIENDGKDPTVYDIQQTVDIIEGEDIAFVILQAQFSSDFIASLSEDTGVQIISLDTLAPNYIENMRDIVDTMLEIQNK